MELDDQTLYVIGQGLGILAVVLGFVSFQMKLPRGILLMQLFTATVFAAHYLLIGEPTGAVLNLLAGVQCAIYYIRDKRGSRDLWTPILFALMTVVSGILTWENWYSILLMAGLVVNLLALSLPNPQMTRKLLFVKSPLCLAYNALVLSLGGVIYECAVLISAVFGLIKYRKQEL
jgi:hypothetical protein